MCITLLFMGCVFLPHFCIMVLGVNPSGCLIQVMRQLCMHDDQLQRIPLLVESCVLQHMVDCCLSKGVSGGATAALPIYRDQFGNFQAVIERKEKKLLSRHNAFTVFVDLVQYFPLSRRDLLTMLTRHIRCNVINVGVSAMS